MVVATLLYGHCGSSTIQAPDFTRLYRFNRSRMQASSLVHSATADGLQHSVLSLRESLREYRTAASPLSSRGTHQHHHVANHNLSPSQLYGRKESDHSVPHREMCGGRHCFCVTTLRHQRATPAHAAGALSSLHLPTRPRQLLGQPERPSLARPAAVVAQR